MTNPDSSKQQTAEKSLGRGMLYLAWILAFALFTGFSSFWLEKRDNPNSMPDASTANGTHQVTLQRNHQHHYVTTGYINNTQVKLLIDTGATNVSVPKHLASELGLIEGVRGYAQTANGTVEVSSTVIDTLSIGPISLYDIRASINPGMQQDEVLLGMSALKNIEFTHRNGTLVLKQFF